MPSVAAANALGIHTNSNPVCINREFSSSPTLSLAQDSGNSTGYETPARAVDPATGKRSYTVSAYLEPNFNRSNLFVLTGALVSKIIFRKDGNSPVVAVGVEYIVDGKHYKVSAKKEVILAAGLWLCLVYNHICLSGVVQALWGRPESWSFPELAARGSWKASRSLLL